MHDWTDPPNGAGTPSSPRPKTGAAAGFGADNVIDLGRVRAWRRVAQRVEDLQSRQAEVRRSLDELGRGLRSLQGSMSRSLETLQDSQRLLGRMVQDMRDCHSDCLTCTDVLDRGDMDEIVRLRDELLARRQHR